MNLEIEVKNNAEIVTNVQSVSAYYINELQKYKGCVASIETLKEDKKKCADINKLKKFVSEQRIAFDKAVNAQPDVLAVHNALKAIEDECDAVRNPYWETCKTIEDASKPAEQKFAVELFFCDMTAKQLESLKKKLAKDGIEFAIKSMVAK